VMDVDAIRAIVLDYFEGWFDGDEARMDRALHPDLVKRRAGEELQFRTKEQMLEFTRAGEGKAEAVDQPIEVEVADVYRDIATVVVSSGVYHEYLHLVRTQDGWKIANALWVYS
jgi:ketosteroid isomerase-like protein